MFKAVDAFTEFLDDHATVTFDDGWRVRISRVDIEERGIPSYWSEGAKTKMWTAQLFALAEGIRAMRDAKKYGANFMDLYHAERTRMLACQK